MELRSGDRLLLHQEAGADFHFSPHSERIDALIADGLHGMRAHNLPVIILRALIYRLYWLSLRRKTQEIEPAIAAQIGGVKDHRRARWLFQQPKMPPLIPEPDQRPGRAFARS